MLDIISSKFSSHQYSEIQKWIDSGAIEWEFKTLCDIRKLIESHFWEWFFTNKEILDRIRLSWGIFTNRPETDTWDYCFVDLEVLIKNLKKNIFDQNIVLTQEWYRLKVEELLV